MSVFLPPDQTRLVTICAHVDHGKTTLADNLIQANGIISERLAGTLRYLDSLEEEQRRGITMRASAIGLRHVHKQKTDVVVHLLDSPGHTDFSTEVSSSLQCCDGCLLVIDAVEGMGARTHQVLREAHNHQLVPILVINKVDRLCTNLCLSPAEAYLRLRTLIESVNATCAKMLASRNAENEMESTDDEDSLETQQWTFEPAKGNVIFASALYGWGFSVPALARSLFRQKIVPIKPLLLKQYLFGDFKYRASDGKILKWKQDSTDEPLFAEFGLQPIWDLYEGIASASAACGGGSSLFADGRIVSHGQSKQAKILATTPGMDQVLATLQTGATANAISTLEDLAQVLTRTGSSTEDAVLRSVLRRYRPLSDIVLDSIYEQCPSPARAASEIRPKALALAPPHDDVTALVESVRTCDTTENAPAVAHVCKFMATDRSHIRDPHLSTEEDSDSVILGLARVLSGRLKTGDHYHVMGPKHAVDQPAPKRAVRLYLLMGSAFVLVDEVPAGHLCAVQNLDDLQLKTATLSSLPNARPLQGFDLGVRPLVKVNVESVDAADTARLERGLIKLSLADAAVEVTATAKGERLLACLGELHLEQSILDLKKVYCAKDDMELRISDPIVEFGETTDWLEQERTDFGAFYSASQILAPLRQSTIPPYNEEEGLEHACYGRSRAILTGRLGAISLRTVPLKLLVFQSLQQRDVVEGSEESLSDLGKALGIDGTPKDVLASLLESLCSIDDGENALIESKALREGRTIRGVESVTGEIHVQRSQDKSNEPDTEKEHDVEPEAHIPTSSPGLEEYQAVREQIQASTGDNTVLRSSDRGAQSIWKNQMQGSVVAGFQMALRAGPICEEPVRGILVVLEGVEVAVTPKAESNGKDYECAKPLSGGMVVSALRSGIRCALLTRPVRLMERHLKLTLHSSFTAMGSLYTVLSKRRGKVLEDDMVEGTDLLMITATIPHAESFGLAPELFRESSGEVTAPELIFSHWDCLEQDPFWIPTSLEEREDFGEIVQNGNVSTGMDNTALTYIRKVRERKGLLVDSSRTVVAAEKQRTLKR